MGERIHIQHVVLSLQAGGLENGVVNVINRLDPARFRSSVSCLKVVGEFAQRIQRADVEITALGLKGGNNLGIAVKLATQLRRARADIVHTRNPESFFYGFLAAKLARIPVLIHSEHGRTFDDRPMRFRVQRWMSRSTTAIFAVSEQLKNDLARHVRIPLERIEVLYNGVDFGRFGAVDRDRCRLEWGLPAGSFVLGSVGRLVSVKNYGLLLRAVSQMGNERVYVVLVGEGPEREALTRLAETLGIAARVKFLGHRENVAGLLGAMDVFVLPSLSEGMSNTLLEALAAKLVVIASDVGGNREIVRDGQDGLLFPNDDLDALKDKIGLVLTDSRLRAKLAQSGRERVQQTFDIQAMVRRYENLYERSYGIRRGAA